MKNTAYLPTMIYKSIKDGKCYPAKMSESGVITGIEKDPIEVDLSKYETTSGNASYDIYDLQDEFYNKEAEMLERMRKHVHVSMCVEGTTIYHGVDDKLIDGKKADGMLFKCTDSKRGVFYIGWYK